MQRDFHQTKEELIYIENEPGSVELLKGAGIVFSGRLVGRGLGFLSHFLFARLLGPTHYGVLLLSMALFNFAGLLADLGHRSGVLRESAAAEGRGDHKMVREKSRCNGSSELLHLLSNRDP